MSALKRVAAVVAALLAVAAAALYVRGVRIGFDGGRVPRFLTTAPDYDALDADRARQRRQSLDGRASAGTPGPGLAPAAQPPPGAALLPSAAAPRPRAGAPNHPRR